MSADEPQTAAPPGGPQMRRRRAEPLGPEPQLRAPAFAEAAAWPDGSAFLNRLLEERRARKRRVTFGLLVFCVLPAVLTALYMLFVASPRYATKLELTYQTYQPQQSLSSGLVQTVLGTSAGSTVDLSTLLYEYIRSPALMNTLDKQLQLRKHYSSRDIDLLSRLNPNAPTDAFLRYYHRHVQVAQGAGGYLTVTVSGFDPAFTLAVANGVIRNADVMVDNITGRARQDEVRSAELLVQKAEAQVRQTRQALTAYQNSHGELDPQTTAGQISGIAGTLEGQLANYRAQLTGLERSAPRSPQIPVLRSQIAAIERQLSGERYRLANRGQGLNYAKQLDEYSKLQIQQDFAKNAYMAAQNGLAVARADAASKQNYIVDFAPPYAPEKQNLWLALIYGATVLISTMAIFGIGSLIYGTVKG